jgi:hypothetical protein
MITTPSRQRGMTTGGMVSGLVLAVVLGMFLVKAGPAYLDFNTINTVIKSVLSDGKIGLMSVEEIRSGIQKRFDINNVEAISARQIAIRKQGGTLLVSVDYEIREDFFRNIDLVMTFKKDYQKSVR